MNKLSQQRVDTMIEAYVAWREACEHRERDAEAYARLVRAANQFVLGEPDRAGEAWELGLSAGHGSRG